MKKILLKTTSLIAAMSAIIQMSAMAEYNPEFSNAEENAKYYLTDGIFEIDIESDDTLITSLYKNDVLIDCVLGNTIDVRDLDFDTLSVYQWSDTEQMVPVGDKITLSYDEVMGAESKKVQEPVYGDVPTVYLNGDITDMTKETRVTLQMTYESATDKIEGYVSAKWQGNYSLNFDKKNYAIKVYKDENCDKKLKTSFLDWDKSNNYVLKANWIDSTQARNIVCAQLFESLPNSVLPNGASGVIDGFPIRLYINDEYRGIYTWNKPKKEWIFGMDGDNEKELIYFSDYALGSCLFERKYSADRYWDLVYPDEHNSAEEMDRVTGFVADCTDEEFREYASEYFDMDSLLNFYVFSQIIMNCDGVGKNINLATFDGNIWYVRPYDMDAVFGLAWHGKSLLPYTTDMDQYFGPSRLWQKLEDNFPQEIYDRYILLRNNELSEEAVLDAFKHFMDWIGDDLYNEDFGRWSAQPSKSHGYEQIEEYVNARYPYLDSYMEQFNIEGKSYGGTVLSSCQRDKGIRRQNRPLVCYE